MSVYKLAATGTGGVEDGAAQLDIQFDGVITAIFGTLRATLDADAEFALAELSFISSQTMGNNDTRGSLMLLQLQQHVTTSGSNSNCVNEGVSGVEIPVNAGERLWMHLQVTASTASNADFYVYVNDGQPRQTTRARR